MLLAGDLSRLRSERIADDLGISPTTLRRRLRADDTNYQALLDQVRQYRCEKQLSERWLPGKCLAWELGYAEVNSFYRAFRRWTGFNYSEIKLRYV
jgi:AraC-like DNA-binding protein